MLAKSLPSRENYSAEVSITSRRRARTRCLGISDVAQLRAHTYVTMRAISSRHTLIELHI